MFPLGTVVFPFTAVPLRVFEPRYQTLLDRVLAGDRTFGIVLIERGFEVGGGDQRFAVGSRVRVAESSEIPDSGGQRAVVVAATERIRVVEWLPDDPHPWARVERYPDRGEDAGIERVERVQAQLRRVLALASELGADVSAIGLEVAEDDLAASYQLAALTPVTPLDAQRLLEAEGPAARLDLAVELLAGQAELLTARLAEGG